ncbi:PREDICTED: uncharacterized protein LOC108569035 [Nicrophorus vespilloides]|uniref:Uncharacterized protein LOC108569035 n=1 Tax=Nicrophorus vespilloides TaxID=110193 RepID=A0ABM1NGG0_NICVS|nr:PREDICTED: uncharacterized protein LOC108569035 [Nicrophorus vespilloides]
MCSPCTKERHRSGYTTDFSYDLVPLLGTHRRECDIQPTCANVAGSGSYDQGVQISPVQKRSRRLGMAAEPCFRGFQEVTRVSVETRGRMSWRRMDTLGFLET